MRSFINNDPAIKRGDKLRTLQALVQCWKFAQLKHSVIEIYLCDCKYTQMIIIFNLFNYQHDRFITCTIHGAKSIAGK